jgi:hypothetical protein
MAEWSFGATDDYVEMWIGPNSASLTGAYAGASSTITGDDVSDHVAYDSARQFLSLTKVVVLGGTTTVYMSAHSWRGLSTTAAIAAGAVFGVPNVTGITAVRIA